MVGIRLVEADGDRFHVVEVPSTRDAVLAWAHALPTGDWRRPAWVTSVADGTASVGLASAGAALSCLAALSPDRLRRLAEDLAFLAGDHVEARVVDGTVEISVGYVGDAGGGDEEPHDATWRDYGDLSAAAAEAGFSAKLLHSDHDSFEVRLTPVRPVEAVSPPVA